MIKCVLLKRPLGLQLQADWIHPKVNFFPLGFLQSGSGRWGCIEILPFGSGAVLEDEQIWGQSHCPSPTIDPGAHHSDECQRQM